MPGEPVVRRAAPHDRQPDERCRHDGHQDEANRQEIVQFVRDAVPPRAIEPMSVGEGINCSGWSARRMRHEDRTSARATIAALRRVATKIDRVPAKTRLAKARRVIRHAPRPRTITLPRRTLIGPPLPWATAGGAGQSTMAEETLRLDSARRDAGEVWVGNG